MQSQDVTGRIFCLLTQNKQHGIGWFESLLFPPSPPLPFWDETLNNLSRSFQGNLKIGKSIY